MKIKEKVSFNFSSEASYVYILIGQRSLKMPKMVNLGDFLKSLSLWSNSVTRQVNINRKKIGRNSQNYSKYRICIFLVLPFSTNFCLIKSDLYGYTVWLQASAFQNLSKLDHFWHLYRTFVHWKCKRSTLRTQFWMRLFGVIFKHCAKFLLLF